MYVTYIAVFYFSHTTKGTQWTHPRTGKKKVVSGGEESSYTPVSNGEVLLGYVNLKYGKYVDWLQCHVGAWGTCNAQHFVS
jgi:hypothetical protein